MDANPFRILLVEDNPADVRLDTGSTGERQGAACS